MGARGNSGVITSQILRGLCEGSVRHAEDVDAASIGRSALRVRSRWPSQAVRKPVEGTILTVLKDSAAAAQAVRARRSSRREEALAAVVDGGLRLGPAHAGVCCPCSRRTASWTREDTGWPFSSMRSLPSLTGQARAPMRDEHGVCAPSRSEGRDRADQRLGGFGLPVLHGVPRAFRRRSTSMQAKDFLPTMGDCDLMVGMHPNFKVHVHSNRPDEVLRLVPRPRRAGLRGAHPQYAAAKCRAQRRSWLPRRQAEVKPLGFVAVAAGEGNAKILESPGCGRGRFGRSDHEPLDEGPARRRRSSVNADSRHHTAK